MYQELRKRGTRACPGSTRTGHALVAIVAYEGVQILDVAGPLQALSTANDEGADPRYDLVVVSGSGGLVRTASGLEIRTRRFPRHDRIDTLLIAGGPGMERARDDRRVISFVRRASEARKRICTVCTGTFIAASAGILDGRRAVTHWRACERLAREFPAIKVERDPIFLRQGHVWSSAGVTAGIDLALALIEQDHDARLAAQVARRLVVFLRRPGGQSQYSEPLALQSPQGPAYSDLLAEVAADPARDWTIDTLAERAQQSVRTFFRRFKSATGHTPATAVKRIRLERARVLLETSTVKVDAIARQSGFGSLETLRRELHRELGISPGALRGRFAPGQPARLRRTASSSQS
jgi:transcriptional regulator GlxA family with amidase domain